MYTKLAKIYPDKKNKRMIFESKDYSNHKNKKN